MRIDVPRRLRNTNRHPEKGSSCSFSWPRLPGPSPPYSAPPDPPLPPTASTCHTPNAKPSPWGKLPACRANSAAAAHNRFGIGTRRPVCALRQRSKRRPTFRMLLGISGDSLAIVGPPRLRSNPQAAEDMTLATMARSSHVGSPKGHRRFCFPVKTGGVLDPDNMIRDRFLPTLQAAGIRAVRFHDLRHTFGAMLMAAGAPLSYVKEQMGHPSIQVTVDTYGHLIPGVGERYVDRLDSKTSPQQSATQPQPTSAPDHPGPLQVSDMIGSGGEDRTPDLGIMRPSLYH